MGLDLIILLLLLSNNGEYMIPNMLILYNDCSIIYASKTKIVIIIR